MNKGSSLQEALINDLTEAPVERVLVGLHWTVVSARLPGEVRCGLASTLPDPPGPHGGNSIPQAGKLAGTSCKALASWLLSDQAILRSIGTAALNALLPPPAGRQAGLNAAEVIAERGKGQRVALVGHFPFIEQVRSQVGHLDILDYFPTEGEFPAEAAPQIIPQAQVVAITGMTFVNHTLDTLLSLCSPDATVLLLGPSTPLSPLLFDYGVDILSGTVVTHAERVFTAIAEGANFRQLHRHGGVKLVTITVPIGRM